MPLEELPDAWLALFGRGRALGGAQPDSGAMAKREILSMIDLIDDHIKGWRVGALRSIARSALAIVREIVTRRDLFLAERRYPRWSIGYLKEKVESIQRGISSLEALVRREG